MTSFSRMFFPPLALLLLLLKEQKLCVTCYIRSLPHRTNQNTSYKLHLSPNVFSGLTSTRSSDGNHDNLDTRGNDRIDTQKERNLQSKIEFSNFWGTKLTSTDNKEISEMSDPRHVPFVSTLDVRDGPLPRGAYIMEGKPEFDTKTTCRISIDVNTGNVANMDDSDTVVRRLQACVDAGFDTFQLHDQTSRSLGIIRRMNENTPLYVNTHWSVNLKIKSISSDSIFLSTKANLRQTILDLVEQTGSDALDSLKVDFCNLDAKKSVLSDDIALEMFDHLIDLQREGWIRSIGVRDMGSQKLRHDVMTYFGDHIDFEEREGSLLLPPFSSDLHNPNNNIRMSNALAGGLLTDLYINDRRRGKTNHHSSLRPQPLLTNNNNHLLNEWANRREQQQKSTSTLVSAWKQYQDHVVGQLGWIALKHDVSISAVALRWALECGSNAIGANQEGPIVSSALTDIVFDDPYGDVAQKLVELRQVFRFQLDEEDKHILSDLSGSQHDESENNEQENPDIDFNNPTLWI